MNHLFDVFVLVLVPMIISVPVVLLLIRHGRKLGIGQALAGLVPTIFVFAAALFGHIYWLLGEGAADHSAYSPAMFLLVGFPVILINLAANMAVARWASK
ncbi:hypothetical protein [Novosphingobium sp.]|uniref:hypothetical protein n=1 Tax=Novosphingobium sp. TaxID=1874826 RepID=UPI003BAD32B5